MDESSDYTDPIDEALEGEPRAAELKRMRRVLAQRLAGLVEELKAETDETKRVALTRDIKKLREQVHVLGEEADITQFVEDAVRVGIEMRNLGS
jgi:hypothetical protein